MHRDAHTLPFRAKKEHSYEKIISFLLQRLQIKETTIWQKRNIIFIIVNMISVLN